MLSAAIRRNIRESIPRLRRRLGELHRALQHDHIRTAVEDLYARASESQRIDFDSLTGDEAALLLLSLEQTVTRLLIDDLEQLELTQQNAAGN